MAAQDWPGVREVYEAGIATGNATLEGRSPEWPQWDAAHRRDCRLVAERDGRVVGWAALSPVSDRCAYDGVAEASVYVAADCRGTGIGKRLMSALVVEAEAAGVWTVQAGILTENTASLRLAEQTGFRLVGLRERLGKVDGHWRDIYVLERRSRVVGTD